MVSGGASRILKKLEEITEELQDTKGQLGNLHLCLCVQMAARREDLSENVRSQFVSFTSEIAIIASERFALIMPGATSRTCWAGLGFSTFVSKSV